MQIERRYTEPGGDPYAGVEFAERTSQDRQSGRLRRLRGNAAGARPQWSQVAVDILAQKYFRKAGVATELVPVAEDGVPEWLARSEPAAGSPARRRDRRAPGVPPPRRLLDLLGLEARLLRRGRRPRVLRRAAGHARRARSPRPNTPQWFNTGLHWAYGIDGPPQGHWYVDPADGELKPSTSAYERPPRTRASSSPSTTTSSTRAASWTCGCARPASSSTAPAPAPTSPPSAARASRLSGGGKSSGLMSFLKIGDRAAGAIKSGGTTRRAAKMVVARPRPSRHRGVRQLEGRRGDRRSPRSWPARGCSTGTSTRSSRPPPRRAERRRAVRSRDRTRPSRKAVPRRAPAGVPDDSIQRALDLARQGVTRAAHRRVRHRLELEGVLHRLGPELATTPSASRTTSCAPSRSDDDWHLYRRTEREGAREGRRPQPVARRCRPASCGTRSPTPPGLCADPGVQFHDTTNEWHTCPADGDINASNPCSEYVFLDDTACNLASLNLLSSTTADGVRRRAVPPRVAALDGRARDLASAWRSSRPARSRAAVYDYRTLGLGYANMGALLMRAAACPYDSPEADRAVRRPDRDHALLRRSPRAPRWPAELGPFPAYERNREAMLRVVRNHRRAAYDAAAERVRGAHRHCRCGIDAAVLRARPAGRPRGGRRPRARPRRAARLSQRPGHADRADRHDRPGDGLRHDRHRARLRAREVQEAGRRRLLQDRQRIRAAGASEPRLHARAGRRHRALLRRLRHARGLPAPGAREAASARVHGRLHRRARRRACARRSTCGSRSRASRSPTRSASSTSASTRTTSPARASTCSSAIGFTAAEIDEANLFVCGTMTVEGAPHLKAEHLPVFDCANKCGRLGTRCHPPARPRRDDGGGPAVPLRRHLQDHQHAERRHHRRRGRGLPRLVAADAEGQRAVPRRLEAVAAAQLAGRRGTGVRRGGDRGRGGRRAGRELLPSGEEVAARVVVEYLRERRRLPDRRAGYTQKARSAATRCTSARASTPTARSARSSSTCTRRAPPSGA